MKKNDNYKCEVIHSVFVGDIIDEIMMAYMLDLPDECIEGFIDHGNAICIPPILNTFRSLVNDYELEENLDKQLILLGDMIEYFEHHNQTFDIAVCKLLRDVLETGKYPYNADIELIGRDLSTCYVFYNTNIYPNRRHRYDYVRPHRQSSNIRNVRKFINRRHV